MAYREQHEHGGVVRARQLLSLDDDEDRLVIHVGSFTAEDDREPAGELDAPTVLAWRLLEDICEVADDLEAEADEDGHPVPDASWITADMLATLTDDALASNPQFFPPFLLEKLSQGAFVTGTKPDFDPEAVGFFEETEAGTRIVLVAPNLLAEPQEVPESFVRRELLLTLCHEFEHHYGAMRGYDPLADREAFFDGMAPE